MTGGASSLHLVQGKDSRQCGKFRRTSQPPPPRLRGEGCWLRYHPRTVLLQPAAIERVDWA